MSDKLKVGLVLVALLAVTGLGVTYPKVDVSKQGPQGLEGPVGPVGPQGPQGLQGLRGPQGLTGPQGLRGPAGESAQLGSVTGPTFPSPNCTNGFCTAVVEGLCNDATTTLARIPTPFTAGTSTVTSVFLRVTAAATTTSAQGSPVVNLGTTTIGSAPAQGSATSSSALLSGVALPNLATTTVFVNGVTGVFIPGLGGRAFEVGPKSTTSPFQSVAVLWLGGSTDTVGGWTNLANIASCFYKVEFKGVDPR